MKTYCFGDGAAQQRDARCGIRKGEEKIAVLY